MYLCNILAILEDCDILAILEDCVSHKEQSVVCWKIKPEQRCY